MKRILFIAIFLIISAFSMPILAIKNDIGYQSSPPQFAAKDSENLNEQAYESLYDSSATVKLLLDDGSVTELSLSEYLMGVLCAEMPASFPEEALKAQAVAARTYTLYKRNINKLSADASQIHGEADVCSNPSHCSAYRSFEEYSKKLDERYVKAVENAVLSTDGQVLEYNKNPIAAVFHAVSVGKTESASDVWGTNTPYLLSVDSPGAEDDPYCYADVSFTLEQFREIFNKVYPNADLSGEANTWFKASVRSSGGSIIDVDVGGVRVTGAEIRSLFGLNSANFTVSNSDSNFVFHTAGRGHGVGLSQYGARRMALDGKKYTEILSNYYPNAELVRYQ